MTELRIKSLKYLSIFFALAVLLSLSYFRVFDEFELSTLDLRFKLRPPKPVDKDIVIIHVGDKTINNLGEWPIPRKYHALLVKALKSAGVKDIVFDIFFSESTKDDEVLANDIQKAGNVYLPYVFEIDFDNPQDNYLKANGFLAPLIDPLKKVCKDTGYINIQPDVDGKVRRIIAVIGYENNFRPHITVLTVLNHMGISFDDVKIIPGSKIIASEDVSIPLGENSTMLVNYPAVWGKAFRHYSYVDILQSYLASMTGKEPILDLSELKDSVCFIGFTAAASPDAHPAPMERLYPGVGVHASIYNSILNQDFLYRSNRLWNLLILSLIWSLTAFITARARKRFAVFSIVLILFAYFLVAVSLFCFFGVWIDMFYPMITMVGIYIVFTFRKYIIETKKREVIEKELGIAKDIQQSFLPTKIPQLGGLDIHAEMLTARQVGGDLYDVLQLDEEKLGVMLGDVSGKGVPAALFMARAVSVFKTHGRMESPSEAVIKVNNNLCDEEISSNLFVTLTYMIFDTAAKKVKYTSGGHNPTLFMDKDGNSKWLELEEGMPLGLIEGDYSEDELEYEPGSVFVLYTDGVTEAMDIKGNMFGEDRLEKLVKSALGKTAEEIAKMIQAEVALFAGKAKQHDDITVLVVCT